MLLSPYYYWVLGRSAPSREHKNTERVSVNFRLKTPVREQRGTIIPNWFINPTTNPTTFYICKSIPFSINRNAVIAYLSKRSNNTRIYQTTFLKIQQQNPTTFLVLEKRSNKNLTQYSSNLFL